jgi:hypothetical protein
VGRPFISEGGGKTAVFADHRCPEDTGMDTLNLKVVSLETLNESIENLHFHTEKIKVICLGVTVKMPVSSMGYVVGLKILAFTY